MGQEVAEPALAQAEDVKGLMPVKALAAMATEAMPVQETAASPGGAAGAVGAGRDGGGILGVPVVQLVTRGCPLTARHELSMGALPLRFRMQ